MEKELLQLEKYIDEIVGLMEDTADNTRLIKEIQSEVKNIKESTTKNSDFKAEIENIKDLIAKVKTIKGEDGKDGRDGVDGKDGKNGIDGKDGESIKGEDGKDGTDGKDGSPDTPKDIKEKLESLKKEKRLDVSAIKGIDEKHYDMEQRFADALNRIAMTSRSSGGGTGTVTGTGSTGTLPYWTSASALSYAPDHTMSVVTGRSYMSMAVWSGNPPLTFSNATGYTAMSQSDGFTTGWSIGQGSSGFLNLNGTGGQGVILDGDGTGYFLSKIGIGVDPNVSTASLEILAGTATTPPIKLTSGTLTTGTDILAGNIEFLTDKYYGTITTGPARKEIVLADAALTSGRVPYVTTNGRLTDSANLTFNGTDLTLAKNLALPTFSTGDSSQGVIYRGAVSAANRFIHTYRAGSTTVENLFLGFGAGNFTLTGATAYNGGGNTGIGHSSLASITSGYSNLGIGLNTLGLVTTGSDNVALGQNSLANLVGGVNCVGVGTRTGQYSTGGYNFFMGNDAGRGSAGSTTGTGNIYVGFQAGTAFTTASNNMVFGYQAGILLSSGGNNILIGASVAGTLTTGASNIIIGKSSGVSSATVSNELNIGNAIYGTGMYGTASIGIGITPTNITARLHLPAGTATASTAPLKITSGGTLLTSAEDGAIETASDKIYFTIPTGTARKEFTLNDIALTSGRVPYATTNGRLTDSSALTYSGTGLTINGAFFSGDGGGFTGIYIGNDGSIADNNDQMWIGDDGSGNAVICADTSLRRVGMGTVVPSGLYGRLHIGAIDNSEIIFRLEGAGGGAGNPTENTHLSKGTTTNATATTIGTYSVSNGYCFQFDTRVVGHRTGGSAGAANDSASYWLRATFKYTGGAIVQIGTTDKLAHEDQAGWDANWVISGNDLLLQVTGATNNDVAWSSISRVMILNT